MVDRTVRLNVQLSEDEHAMLGALAEKRGVSVSDVVRMWIRDSYAETFGDKKPKKAGK